MCLVIKKVKGSSLKSNVGRLETFVVRGNWGVWKLTVTLEIILGVTGILSKNHMEPFSQSWREVLSWTVIGQLPPPPA